MPEEVQKRFTYYGQKDRTARGEITHLRFVISDFKFDDDTHKECALVVNMTSCHNSSKDDMRKLCTEIGRHVCGTCISSLYGTFPTH